MMSGIVFQVDTTRVLQILAKEIYDSPLAMLRENLQNAYDAVRERFAESGTLTEGGRITLDINGRDVVITDNGIGMTEAQLRENFWRAGSSGKRSERARKAGVVGTFGIGAMANFGVCSQISVTTKSISQNTVLISTAVRDDLKIGEECILFSTSSEDMEYGTRIHAVLDEENNISLPQAIQYLESYISLLPVDVIINGVLRSQANPEDKFQTRSRSFTTIGLRDYDDGSYSASFTVQSGPNAQLLIRIDDIKLGGMPVLGRLVLLQSGGQLMGLRSSFGLAPTPAMGNYQFGGFADLSTLQPTAGREALSRESVVEVNRLVSMAERVASEMIARTDLADQNNAFLGWIVNNNRYDLASRVSISTAPDDKNVELAYLRAAAGDRSLHYYAGNDKQIITTFSSEQSLLALISPNNPRRRVQQHYLTSILSLPSVPDSAQIIKQFERDDLDYADVSILLRIGSTLRDDYLLPDIAVDFCHISHGVSIIAEKKGDTLQIYLDKRHPSLPSLKEFYEKAYDLFSQFIKDFVRVSIYPKIQQYVPTSTKGGVDALRKLLEKSKELYRLEEADRDDLENVLGDYLSGKESFPAILNIARNRARPQTQFVSAEQVGTIEAVLPDIADSPVATEPSAQTADLAFDAAPPISRIAIETDMKLLTTSERYPALNNFVAFLGLSDKLIKTEGEFFNRPHTTRVIWGGHRIVYIFTEETGHLSLYYDIELKSPLSDAKTGGSLLPTTTVLTKKRIYVPIPDVLSDEFEVAAGPKEFFVRFDILTTDTGFG